MPGYDGTGPWHGFGRGMGPCRRGVGYRRGWGFPGFFGLPEMTKDEQKKEIERAIRIQEERIETLKEMLKQLK